MKRKQLFSEKNKWGRGTLMIEDGICLVENDEGDILLADSLGNADVLMKRGGRWRLGTDLRRCGRNRRRHHPLLGGEEIRYEKAVKRPLLTLLDSLDDETFLLFLSHLHGFGLSVYDCVFSYDQALFSGEGVSFYHFSADEAQCALQSITAATRANTTDLNGRHLTGGAPLCIQRQDKTAPRNKQAAPFK